MQSCHHGAVWFVHLPMARAQEGGLFSDIEWKFLRGFSKETMQTTLSTAPAGLLGGKGMDVFTDNKNLVMKCGILRKVTCMHDSIYNRSIL